MGECRANVVSIGETRVLNATCWSAAIRMAFSEVNVYCGGTAFIAASRAASVCDVLTKSIGTNNPINQVKATMEGLRGLRKPEDVAELRGLTIKQVLGIPKREQKPEGDEQAGSGAEAVDPVAVVTEEAPPEGEKSDG